MQYNDILTLARAGFNAQQISALSQMQVPATPLQQMQVPAAPLQQMQVPAAPLQQMQVPASIDSLSRQISDLQQTIQLGNILGVQQPQALTTDEILASIINPIQPGNEVK